MSDKFLRIFKDWFLLGLSPIEVMVMAQIAEYNINNRECYETDAQFAKDFNVSESTITRAMKSLESKGFIKRHTTTTQAGKKRTIVYNQEQVESAVASVKMSLAEEANRQNDSCGSVKLTVSTQQNDLIKDNREEINEKDNFSEPSRK